MEITSKQRAKLRGMAQNIETIAQFGKNELSPEQITMVEQMLTKRKLIKCSVLDLPNVIDTITVDGIIEYIAGDMMEQIPPTDAVG